MPVSIRALRVLSMDEQDAETGEADILRRLGQEINSLQDTLKLRREKRL